MNTRTTPRDFFIHLGATIVLYVAAVALINLAFSAINYAFPDALANYFSAGSIVWPVSMLIVLTPAFYILEWSIGRDLARSPEKREIWIRRWRIYLTLFLTGATIIGDLIALINTYLNGEISSRFIYKVLVVLIVSAVIFSYYLLARAAEAQRTKNGQRILAWLGIIIVIAGIVGGFVIVGSPAKQRALRFDNQRVSDLNTIQNQVINYWQQKNKLPTTLADLNDSISGYVAPKDPQNHQDYQYALKSTPLSFELCADFSEPSQDTSGRGAYYGGMMSYPMPVGIEGGDNWKHPAGHECFERTIDPSRYPSNRPVKGI